MKKYKIAVYRAKDGWRWRVTHRNGRIIADGAEAYKRKGTLIRSVLNLFSADQSEFEVVT